MKLLAGRINQPHVIRTYFQKVADYYYKKGQEDALKNERLANVSKPDFEECPECKSKDIEVAKGFGRMAIYECHNCCEQFSKV